MLDDQTKIENAEWEILKAERLLNDAWRKVDDAKNWVEKVEAETDDDDMLQDAIEAVESAEAEAERLDKAFDDAWAEYETLDNEINGE